MASERIGDMTREELEAFVRRIIAQNDQQYPYQPRSNRPLKELLASLRKNRIKTNPGEPSTLELLREDRDR